MRRHELGAKPEEILNPAPLEARAGDGLPIIRPLGPVVILARGERTSRVADVPYRTRRAIVLPETPLAPVVILARGERTSRVADVPYRIRRAIVLPETPLGKRGAGADNIEICTFVQTRERRASGRRHRAGQKVPEGMQRPKVFTRQAGGSPRAELGTITLQIRLSDAGKLGELLRVFWRLDTRDR